jgi:hypothetical protein
MVAQRRGSRWTLGKVALVMARIAAYLLAVPGILRVVLECTVGAPRHWRLDLDLMLTSVPIAALAAVLGLCACMSEERKSKRAGGAAVFIAGGTLLLVLIIVAASQPL